MDRKIEHRPLSLVSLFGNWEWNTARMFCNGILLFFTILLIYLTVLYALGLMRMEERYHPTWQQHKWEKAIDRLTPFGMNR
jgi:hypothetical protein